MEITEKEFRRAIKAGEYEVKVESWCDSCSFDWYININDELENDGGCGDSEVYCALYVRGEKIADYSPNLEWNDYIDGLNAHEILLDIESENPNIDVIGEMTLSPDEQKTNEGYNEREKESLIDWLKTEEYKTAIHYPRNFGNEYECVLVEPGAKFPGFDPLKEDWYFVDPEEWANMYIQGNDDDMYVSSSILHKPDPELKGKEQ